LEYSGNPDVSYLGGLFLGTNCPRNKLGQLLQTFFRHRSFSYRIAYLTLRQAEHKEVFDPSNTTAKGQAKFEQVLASPRALEHFRVKGDLEASLLYTEYNAEQITKVLRVAAYSIEACMTTLFDVRENERVKDAFAELERAYRKARLNMKAEQQPPDEE